MSGTDEAQGVGADELGPLFGRPGGDLENIVDRHAVGHDDEELDSRLNGLEGGVFHERRGHEDNARVDRTVLVLRLGDGIVNRDTADILTAAAGGHARHELGAVFLHQPRPDHALAAGDALDDDPSFARNEDRHYEARIPTDFIEYI